jgi:uncharacterized membrane protein YeaQ/YmgE (transglycosylase-associated protein family)
MSVVEFIVLLVIAGICGAIGQAITGFSRGGLFAAIGIGFVGALLGSFISRALGLPELLAVNIGGTSFPIVWSILGAALFVALLALISRRRRVYT